MTTHLLNEPGSPPMLDVDGLDKKFGAFRALTDVGFNVRQGEILGLIGPNGAGKTTLMECVVGLLSADGGKIAWCGAQLPPARRKEVMFYLPDGQDFYHDQPVLAMLDFFAQMFDVAGARKAETIRQLDLGGVLQKRVGELSKGYRRRFLLAVGLLSPQPLLILDEPFDGLDLRQTLVVMGLLRQVRARGRTLLLSIHQLADAEKICDRFLLLDAGRVLGCGTLAELRQRAGNGATTLEEVFVALT